MQAVQESILNQVRESFNFGIQKHMLRGPDNVETPFYGLFRDDNFGVVHDHSVTASYKLHQTEDVLALVEAASVAFDGTSRVQCYFNKGHYVTVSPSDEHRRSIYGSNDNVFPRFHIRAGYDGKSFQAGLGYYRDACLNLSWIRTVSECFQAIRHNGKLRSNMDELIHVFQSVRGGWDALTAKMEEMESRQVAINDYVMAAFKKEPSTPKEVTICRNLVSDVLVRIGRERLVTGRPGITKGFDGIVSAWEAYNGVQGYIEHVATRKVQDAYGRAVKALSDPVVKRAEALALAV